MSELLGARDPTVSCSARLVLDANHFSVKMFFFSFVTCASGKNYASPLISCELVTDVKRIFKVKFSMIMNEICPI